MVEYGIEDLQAGLPSVKEVPKCKQCHVNNAFIVYPSIGIICGLCLETEMKKQDRLKKILIKEAERLDNASQTMPTL